MPDPDDSGVVHVVSGNGFQIVDPPVVSEVTGTVAHIRMHQQVSMSIYPMAIPDWITEAGKHMLKCARLQPVA
jgi:hypothetical protein